MRKQEGGNVLMSESRIVPIMLFVLGLFLIAVGIGLFTVTETVIKYRSYLGFQIPYEATIHPYEGAGGVMIIFGIIVLVVAFMRTRQSKEPETIDVEMEMPQVE
ncbi:hypothetical protein KAT42_05180 [Candidatus Bathyarchaeota archaeon]|nr:hypothetical protein [Candidatus Bathyarchaeota archaeon]